MNTSDRPAPRAGIVFDATFAIIAVAGIAFTVYMLSDSWGASYAIFDTVVAVAMVGLALARRVNLSMTAAAGVALALVAVIVTAVADLPQEPSPIASLALAVLIAAAIRRLPSSWAAGIGAGGLVVYIACWATGGFRAVTVIGTLAYLAAVGVGWSMREVDKGRRTSADRDRATTADHATWR
jgi:hypothetical protein